jgi:hypothetical protein
MKKIKKNLLIHLPVIGKYYRQRGELKRCQKEIRVLRQKIDILMAERTKLDFQDFADFCRRHGIIIKD